MLIHMKLVWSPSKASIQLLPIAFSFHGRSLDWSLMDTAIENAFLIKDKKTDDLVRKFSADEHRLYTSEIPDSMLKKKEHNMMLDTIKENATGFNLLTSKLRGQRDDTGQSSGQDLHVPYYYARDSQM